jgi:hypothetical protein
MSVDWPILGSGGTAETEALWKPHWGVSQSTMEGYATSGKIVFLVRDDMYFASTINTNGTQYRATIKGSSGADKVVDTNDNVQFVFDYTAVDLPTAFPDITGNINGYGTYIIIFEILSGGTLETFNVSAYGTYRSLGHLWCIYNSTANAYLFSASSSYQSRHFEAVKFLSGSIVNHSLYWNWALRSAKGQSFAGNISMAYYCAYCYSLREVEHFLTGTNYTSAYYDCYYLDNDISGTYPNATTMAGMIRYNGARSKPIAITAPNCTSFTTNIGCYSVPSLSITAPLTAIIISYWSNMQTLTLSSTNFGSLGTTTNAIDMRYCEGISSAELTNFITALEDLTGKVTQNILKTGVTNWAASHTTAANAKNWNVV